MFAFAAARILQAIPVLLVVGFMSALNTNVRLVGQ